MIKKVFQKFFSNFFFKLEKTQKSFFKVWKDAEETPANGHWKKGSSGQIRTVTTSPKLKTRELLLIRHICLPGWLAWQDCVATEIQMREINTPWGLRCPHPPKTSLAEAAVS